MKHNDLEIESWKESDINTDSLWLISERDKSGKHANNYHGNFIPQIPNQLIRRFTKKDETIFEPFMGSGTTLFECENLERKYIGFDINPKIVDYVGQRVSAGSYYFIKECNSLDAQKVNDGFETAFDKLSAKSVQFVLMHPPYLDIVKFTDNPNDLSQISNLKDFIAKFRTVCENSLKYLDSNRYFANEFSRQEIVSLLNYAEYLKVYRKAKLTRKHTQPALSYK